MDPPSDRSFAWAATNDRSSRKEDALDTDSRRLPDAPKAIAAATPETGLPGNEDDDRDEAPEDDDVSEEPQLTDPSQGRDHHARSASIRLPCGVLGPGEPTRRRRGLVRMGLGACSASSVERETLLRAATR